MSIFERVMVVMCAAVFVWAGTIIADPESFLRSVAGLAVITIGAYAISRYMGKDDK